MRSFWQGSFGFGLSTTTEAREVCTSWEPSWRDFLSSFFGGEGCVCVFAKEEIKQVYITKEDLTKKKRCHQRQLELLVQSFDRDSNLEVSPHD